MQAITDDPKDKSNKSAGKEKFTRFFDLLDEVVERHKFAQVLEDDPVGKAEIGEEIVMLVVPSFQRFTQKQRDKEFSKSEFLCFFWLGTILNSDFIMLYCRSAEVYVYKIITGSAEF